MILRFLRWALDHSEVVGAFCLGAMLGLWLGVILAQW